jgi:hypothetical protein
MLPITMIDATGLYTAEEVADTLRERGVVLAAAGRQTEWHLWAESRQRAPKERKIQMYPTMNEAIRHFREVETGATGVCLVDL